jgi:hypothetical protein
MGLTQVRASAQLLHRPARQAPGDLVSHLLAVQAQDIGQAPLALRARGRGLTAARVSAARDSGEVVRAWGPRGTIHLIARDDVAWLTALLLPGYLGQARRRLAQEGVQGPMEHLLDVTRRALAGQGPLTKAELGERLGRLGTKAHGQGIVYLAFLAAIHGYAVLGPDRAGKPTYVHSGDWLDPRPATVDRDRALAELAVRYLRAHAPAGPEDLAAWSGLAVGECRTAFSLAGDDIRAVPDSPLWRLLGRSAKASPVPLVLLPGYDEYLLGWRDREPVLSKAHAKAVIPGGGVIRPVVVVDGRVVGTWRLNPVRADLFDDADPDRLAREADDIARFLNSEVSTVEMSRRRRAGRGEPRPARTGKPDTH